MRGGSQSLAGVGGVSRTWRAATTYRRVDHTSATHSKEVSEILLTRKLDSVLPAATRKL